MIKLNTFSITARCKRTGQLGVAVSTKLPAVGMLCPFVQSSVGAIASQSFVNPYLGIRGLEYMSKGYTAMETLEYLKSIDDGIQYRQLGIVDREGGSVSFTGESCDTWNGDRSGENYAIAGNMLVGPETLQAMEERFVETSEMELAERLLDTLQAGQDAGGDKRGRQSAAIKVYSTEEYPLIDLRVDEHADPVPELRRVYQVAKESLLPLIHMLPTHNSPAGRFDFDEARIRGLLQDEK